MIDVQLVRMFSRAVRAVASARAAQETDRFTTGVVAATSPQLTLYLDGNTSVKVPIFTPYTHVPTLSVNQVVDVYIHRGVPRIIGGY